VLNACLAILFEDRLTVRASLAPVVISHKIVLPQDSFIDWNMFDMTKKI